MKEFAIGLGTNMGQRLENLRRARALLAEWPHGKVTETAPVYETQPVDVPPEYAQCLFFNSMLLLETFSGAAEVQELAKSIETGMGRDRSVEKRNGPRIIDLDIVYAGNETVDTPGLRIPHPRWQTRAFVVAPLADLRPDLVLPGEQRTVRKILAGLDSGGIRLAAAIPWW